MCLPLCCTEVEKRALAEAARGAGARDVLMIDEPVAAAIGAGLPVFDPVGSMVVDMGGGTSDVAVLALGGIAAQASSRTGGTHIDAAIMEYVAKQYGVSIGERTAEEIKQTLGSALLGKQEKMQARGRSLSTGLPASVTLSSNEVSNAIATVIRRIVDSVMETLAHTPPELSADLYENGITLTGGGALLHGINKVIEIETGMAVNIDENPLDCVILGATHMLDERDAFDDYAMQKTAAAM